MRMWLEVPPPGIVARLSRRSDRCLNIGRLGLRHHGCNRSVRRVDRLEAIARSVSPVAADEEGKDVRMHHWRSNSEGKWSTIDRNNGSLFARPWIVTKISSIAEFIISRETFTSSRR